MVRYNLGRKGGNLLLLIIVISLFIGILSAFIGSLVGLGGGLILVPILLFLGKTTTLFSWATPQAIVGISLITMVFTGLSSTLGYLRLRRVDMKTGVLFLTGSIPGSIFGAWSNQFFDSQQFSLYFGILMIIIFGLLLLDREKLAREKKSFNSDRLRTFTIDGETYKYEVSPIPAFILAFFVGTLSGLFGIGGGTISVPAMILIFGIPVQVAIGTSMFMIFFISLISTITHGILGHILYSQALFFIVGAYLGGTLGVRVGQHLRGNVLEWLLRIVILIAAIQLIIEGVG